MAFVVYLDPDHSEGPLAAVATATAGGVLFSLGLVTLVCGVSFPSARTPGRSCAVSHCPVTAPPPRPFEQVQGDTRWLSLHAVWSRSWGGGSWVE